MIFRTEGIDVAKPEIGSKRLCGNCGARFYDLQKDPIACRKCATVLARPTAARARPEPVPARKIQPEEETVTPEATDAEFVSLEDADKETEGATASSTAGDD